MKLSEAMMLGSVTCKMAPNDWNSCALGAAANAVGIPQASERTCYGIQKCPDGKLRLWHIEKIWPWINEKNFKRIDFFAVDELTSGLEAIWSRFDGLVCARKMTLEQLVDYVRSIEPDCGTCNLFECTCAKASTESHELQTVSSLQETA